MRHRSIIAVVTILAAGVVGLALIPGQARPQIANPEIANIDAASTAPTGIGAASPTLLRTLDDELAPPKMPTPDTAVPIKTAAIAPASIATATDLAVAATPVATTSASDRIGPSAVNMRSGPSTSAPALSVLVPDQPVQVSDMTNGWAHVTLADGTTGWVYGSYLANGTGGAPTSAPTNTAPTRVASAQPRAVVHGSGDLEDRIAHVGSHLTAYARPLDSAQSVFTLDPGDEVRIAEVRGDWLRVETEDGMTAWIRRAD